jgi:hypothetical protein
LTEPRSPFLDLPAAVGGQGVDAGVPAHYGNPVSEQRSLIGGAIVDLSHRSVLQVLGPDRLSWLDSLTSQSIPALSPGESAESLLLDPTGRLEHVLRLIDDGESTWILVEAGDADALLGWLDRMRFMLRVEVADRSADYATIGALVPPGSLPAAAPAGVALVWRDPWRHIVAGGYQYARIEPHPGDDWTWTETLVSRSALADIAEAANRGHYRVAGLLAAEALRIAAWRPRLATEADNRSIPHELDWMRSAVHLNKGCYRGQETVAKVHNLGHPPRRLVMLQLDGSESIPVARGDAVILGSGPDAREVGLVTSAANHHELGPIALAVIKRSVPEDAMLSVRAADGPVAAAQEIIVPADAGATAGIVRLPRLGAR